MLTTPLVPDHPPQMRGSVMLALAASEEEVWAQIREDVYAREGVWDLERVQVWPVSFLLLFLFSWGWAGFGVEGQGREERRKANFLISGGLVQDGGEESLRRFRLEEEVWLGGRKKGEFYEWIGNGRGMSFAGSGRDRCWDGLREDG